MSDAADRLPGQIPSIKERGSPGQRSVARPFRVLELFDDLRRGARAFEIADRLELPQSTVSGLLPAMVRIGYLDHDPLTRVYHPSMRVTLLGSWRDVGRVRASALMAMIERLAADTGLRATLSNRSGIYIRYLQTLQPRPVDDEGFRTSDLRYAVWCTAGIAILSELDDREIGKLLRRTLAEDTPRAKLIDPGRVRDMVATARHQHWIAGTGINTPNVRAISAVVSGNFTGFGESLALTLTSDTAKLGASDDTLAARMKAEIDRLAH